MSKKTRGPNFSPKEKEILVHLITKHKDVQNKKTDAVTTAIKNEGWRKLTEEFNTLSTVCVRNIEQLKICWDNIKRNTRKDIARTKKEILLAGEDTPNLPPTEPLHSQVEVLLSLSDLENTSDSNTQYPKQYESPTLNGIQIEATQFERAASSATIYQPDECLNSTQENDSSPGMLNVSKSGDGSLIITPEDKDNKMWNGGSPAALKTNVSNALERKEDSPLGLKRRRPKGSLYDKLLESKLELVELMKKNAESEASIKNAILEEQLKQEKLKTKVLELQLNLQF